MYTQQRLLWGGGYHVPLFPKVYPGLPCIREMSGNFYFLQDQENVREFCEMSGKFEKIENVREMSGKITGGVVV